MREDIRRNLSLGTAGPTWLVRSAVLVVSLLGALVSPLTRAATPLTTLEYRIVGTQLQVTPDSLAVPKGIAGSVLVQLTNAGGASSASADLTTGAYVEAYLRGPSFPVRRLVGAANQPLVLPVLNLVGDYQLDGIRLVDSARGDTRLEGVPSSVPVRVFDEVLISKVTSRPLSLQEIQDKGIVVDSSNFRAVEFEVGFVLDGQRIPVKFPVVSPVFKQSTEIIPAAELERRLAEAQLINNDIANRLYFDAFPPELQRPGLNIQVKGVNFQAATAEEEQLGLPIPPIPALMVIPGNIGYLNQFFSVQIFTENAAPAESALSVLNVVATLALPPGPDGITSTNYSEPGDDPLRFARVGPTAEIHSSLPILGPEPERLGRFQPGQGGHAEFLVEGLQEGLHVMGLDLTADLDGLAAGTVKVRGKAAGSVLVRNPKFSLAFSHPDTVRFGEPYDARVTILNTGDTEANLVSVTLRSASISGGVLESPETVGLGNLAPGQSATAIYRVRAQRNGRVTFSNLTTGENSVQGRFNLVMGVDERGVELSPDTIGMPDYVNDLPSRLLDAANRVLGQALSVATAGRLPAGVKPVGRAIITARVLELAEAGQRLRYGDALTRVLMDLLLDWQGGRLLDTGFDQILRETNAGQEFRETVMRLLEEIDPAGAVTRLRARAPDVAGRSEAWVLAAVSSPRLQPRLDSDAGVLELDRSTIAEAAAYRGTNGHWLVSRPRAGVFQWRASEAVTSAELAWIDLGTNGTGRQLNWNLASLPAGGCVAFDPTADNTALALDLDCDGNAESSLAGTRVAVTELPPQVLTVFQETNLVVARPQFRCSQGPANNYGNVLALLFSKPMQQTNANIPEAYQLDGGNHGAGIRVQQGGRVTYLTLREAVSAIIPRVLAVQGVTDVRGNPVDPAPQAIQTAFRDGISLKGRVLRGNGDAAAGVPVTVTFYDPWKDPFDRCDPIVITRIAQKFTDANGDFAFDFVQGGVSVTIAAVDTGGLPFEVATNLLESFEGNRFAREKFVASLVQSNVLAKAGLTNVADAVAVAEGLDRAVWQDLIDLNGGRPGSELVIGLRFRGRGTVAGQVVQADGVTPVPAAAVNLFPDPTSRELGRGLFSDGNGRFQFNGVPLGTFSVQVQSPLRHFRTVSGSLTNVGQSVDLRVVLTAPTSEEVVRTAVIGRVTEPGTREPHAGATVVLSHSSVSGPNSLGIVAVLRTGEDGMFEANDVPVGNYLVRALSRDGKRGGQAQTSATAGVTAFADVTLSGTAEVEGRVETSSGLPVANALVAGGEALFRSSADGRFTLTGVPLGRRTIEAGLEGQFAPGGFPRLGSGQVEVVPGSANFVVVRLRPAGEIVGTVRDAQGNPRPNEKVAIPLPAASGFAWVQADGLGRFRFSNMAPGDYQVVAPSPPVEEDNDQLDGLLAAQGLSTDEIQDQEASAAILSALNAVQNRTRHLNRLVGEGNSAYQSPGSFGFTGARVRFDGDIARADLQYVPDGALSGIVLNDQGVPIGARVRATGLGVKEDATVDVVIRGTRNSDAATGAFEFRGIAAGDWGLQAATPFYPVVITTAGRTTVLDPNVSNIVMQFPSQRDFNGRLAGEVLLPNGQRAGADVTVKIDFSADYAIRTDTNGTFDTVIRLPAKTYRLEASDPATGLKGSALAQVQPGVTNFATVRLLGKGGLELLVRLANGQPAVNASVNANLAGFPGDTYSGATDDTGRFRLQNIFEGRYGLQVTFLTGGARLEARTSIEVVQGQTRSGEISLAGSAIVRGRYLRRDGSAIASARVAIGNVAFVPTDGTGRFEAGGLALGSYRILATDPVTGRAGVKDLVLTVDGQVVDITVVEGALSTISGQVLKGGSISPVAGATVQLVFQDGFSPARQVTTGPDGAFEFAAVMPGPFVLQAGNGSGNASARGVVPDEATNVVANLTLPADTDIGRLTVLVLEPDGTLALNARVTSPAVADTDASGRATFDHLRPGTYAVRAESLLPEETSSVGETNAVLTLTETNVLATVRLSGVGTVSGRVFQNDGSTAVVGAQVILESLSRQVSYQRISLTDSNGGFSFNNVPISGFRTTARSGALAASYNGMASAGTTNEILLRLGASGVVVGRLVRADHATPVTNLTVLLTFTAPSGLDGVALDVTDNDGGFDFDSVPVGPVQFEADFLPVDGIARVGGTLTNNGDALDLGDVVLDEDWPSVEAITPGPGAMGIAINSVIDVLFTEPLRPESIKASGFLLDGPTNRVGGQVQLLADTNGIPRLVRLTPAAPLSSLTTYRITVIDGARRDALGTVTGEGPADLVDRPLLTAFSSTFTTRDDDPPVLVSVFPFDNEEQVDVRAVPRFTFNEPVQGAGLGIALSGPVGPVAGATSLTLNGLAAAFTPGAALLANRVYTLRLDGVRDLAGNLLPDQPRQFTFATLDTIGPTITTLRLADGALPVAGGAVVLEAVLATAEPRVSVRFSRDFESLALVTNTPFQIPVRLPTSGTVRFLAVATDRFGNDGPLAELKLDILPNQAPTVLLTRAQPPSGPVGSSQTFSLALQANDDGGVTNLTLIGDGALSAARQFTNGQPRSVFFTVPPTALAGSTIRFRARASDTLGVNSAETTLDLQVADATPPEVTLIGPTNETQLPASQPLVFRVIASDNSTNLQLTAVLSGALSTTQNLAWVVVPNQPATNELSFSLDQVPAGGGPLDLTLRVTDAATNLTTLMRRYQVPDTKPPRLVSVNPADGASAQSLWLTSVDLEFDESLASSTVTTNAFSLTNRVDVPFSVAQFDSGKGVHINLPLPLVPDEAYVLRVAPTLADAAGNTWVDTNGAPVPPGGASFRFTTAGIREVTPTNGAPYYGGTNLLARVTFDRGLGATWFRFTLTNLPPVVVGLPPDATNVAAVLPVPLDYAGGVLHIAASPYASLAQAHIFEPIPLTFAGNATTNAPPEVHLTRVAPASGPLVGGMSFGVRVSATDDFVVTQLTLTGTGLLVTNVTFPNGSERTLNFLVPAGVSSGTQQFNAFAVDDTGATSVLARLDLPVEASVTAIARGEIVYSREEGVEGVIYVAAADGGNQRLITVGTNPRLSPSGRYLAFQRDAVPHDRANLYVRDVTTGTERLVLNNFSGIFGYGWRPDDFTLAFDNGCSLYEVKRDGSGARTLAAFDCNDAAVAVNIIDGRLAFHNSGYGIRVSGPAPDLTNLRLVPGTGPGSYWPAWSADGEWISFCDGLEGGNMFKVRPDGTGFTPLTSLTGTNRFRPPGGWTADGTRLIVAGDLGGTNGLFAIHTDGSGYDRLQANDGGADYGFVGTVNTGPVPGASPRLLALDPPAGSIRQSLWLSTNTLTFSGALVPEGVTPARILFTNSAGLSVAYTLDAYGTLVRLQPALPLNPGTTWSVVVKPGLTNAAGQAVLAADGQPIPAAGVPLSYSTAAILSVSPTNNTRLPAGGFVTATVNFEPGLGAELFRFVVGNGAPVDIPVGVGDTQASATLGLPGLAGPAVLRISARKPGLPPYDLPSIALQVEGSGGTPAITFLVSNSVQVAVGGSLGLPFLVNSSAGPLKVVELPSTSAPPAFAALEDVAFSLLGTNGQAQGQLRLTPLPGDEGSRLITLGALTENGISATTNVTVNVAPNPAVVFTRWKDPVSGNWSDPARWSDGLPDASRVALMDVAGTYEVTLDLDATVGGLVMGGASGSAVLTVNSRSLTLNGTAEVRANGRLNLAGGQITGIGRLLLQGAMEWTGGSVAGNSVFHIGSTGALHLAGASNKGLDGGRLLLNAGTITWISGDLDLNPSPQGGSGRFENASGGVVDVQANPSIYATGYADVSIPPPSFINSGLFRRSAGSGTVFFYLPLQNRGEIELNSGTFTLYNGGSNSGRITFDVGTEFVLTGNVLTTEADSFLGGFGTFRISSGTHDLHGQFEPRGTFVIESGKVTIYNAIQPSSVVEVRGELVSEADQSFGRLNLSGQLGGASTVTITNEMTWTSGTVYGSGRLIITRDATLTMSGPAMKGLDSSRVLENHGRVVTSGGSFDLNPRPSGGCGRIENAAGALWEIDGDGSIYATGYGDVQSPPPSLVNDGTISRSAGTGEVQVSVPLANSGTIDVSSGQFRIDGGATHSGSIVLATGAELVLANVGFTDSSGAALSGTGVLRVESGTHSLVGTVQLDRLVSQGGTITFAQSLNLRDGVNIAGEVVFDSSQTVGLLTLTGRLGGAGSVTVTNNMHWMSGLAYGSGRLVIADGATLNLDSSSIKGLDGGRLLENHGTVYWDDGDLDLNLLSSGGAGQIENVAGGVWLSRSDRTLYATGYGDINTIPPLLLNRGTWQKSAGTNATSIWVPLDNRSAFAVLTGTLELRGGATNSGTIAAPVGTTLSVQQFPFHNLPAGELDVAGTLNLVSGGGTLAGSLLLSGHVNLSGGDWQFTVPATFNELDFIGGQFGGAAPITVGNQMTWRNGTVYGPARLMISESATLRLLGAAGKGIEGGRILENRGTVIWEAGDVNLNPIPTGGSGRIENRSGATWDVRGNDTLSATAFSDLNDPAPLFANDGLFHKSTGTGTTTIAVPFDNAGAVNVDAGTLVLNGNGQHAGAFSIAPATTLTFGAGTNTLGGVTFAGSGTNRVATALVLQSNVSFGTLQVIFEGSASVSGTFEVSDSPGGALTFLRNVTFPGSLTVRGVMSLANSGVTVEVTHALALPPGAVLNNPGTVRVGSFSGGGTINGNAPIVMDPAPNIVAIRYGAPSGSRIMQQAASLAVEVEIEWLASPESRFAIEGTSDWTNWFPVPAAIAESSRGHYRAAITVAGDPRQFFRVRLLQQ